LQSVFFIFGKKSNSQLIMFQKRIPIFYFLLSILFSFKINSGNCLSPTSDINESIFDVMYRKGILNVNIYFNVDELIENRASEEEQTGAIIFKDKKGKPRAWTIGIKPRGVYRRFQCEEMPPIKINFKKSELKKSGLSKFDDYKLVTHCVKDEKIARNLILKEYLAYKFYNHITPESFRVQLLKIKYIDTKTKRVREHFGFIIEDLGLLRNRIGAKKFKGKIAVPIDSMNLFQYQTMAYFQYLIGNTDWGTNPIKNIKIVIKDGKFLAIPYDFDYTGLVLPPYAKINMDSPLPALKTRIFKGKIDEMKGMDNVISQFIKQKIPMKRSTRELRHLPWKERRKVVRFIDDFFKNIETINILRAP